jgi:hypothetical protein
MRLHRKLTSTRLGAMFSPPLSSFESENWSHPTSPVKECAGWASKVWDDRCDRGDLRAMSTRISTRAFFRFV